MAEIRDRGSVLATEEGVQILQNAKAAKRNHDGKCWTYKDIAVESGMQERTVRRFFKREQPIDDSSARAICQALEVDYNQIVETPSARKPSEKHEPESDWRETCRELLNHWKGLTTNTLTTANGVRFQLDDVFVPLGVVGRTQKPKRSPASGSPEQGSTLYEEKVTPISQDAFFDQVLRQRQSEYSKGSRIAIIGEPGAGKTTQLQKIGDWILDETDGVPIWVPLGAVSTRSIKEYLLNDWLQSATQELEVAPQHREELTQLLKTKKVWLLLDGVDEMPVSDALQKLASQMREGWLQNVRVILTCRLNVWDTGKNALDGFDVYRNLDFKYPTEVHQVIHKWFANDLELQDNLIDALEQPGKERIRDMVKNPLRLTLLCYSWQLHQGDLPDTKAGLYEWFVDTFYEWNKGKVPTELSVMKREELDNALGELAKAAIDQESSRFRLRESFVNRFLGAADDDDSLFHLALQLGWLNHVGVTEEKPLEKVYAFFHPTFQEYFAAVAIDDWNYFLPREHENKPVVGKSYRIFENQWREVVLLWMGRKNIDQELKAELVNKLKDFSDGCDGFYSCQTFFIACETTSEFTARDTSEILKKLVKYACHRGSMVASILSSDAILIAGKVPKDLVKDQLSQILESSSGTDTKLYAIEILEKVDPNNRLIQKLIESDLDLKHGYTSMNCKILGFSSERLDLYYKKLVEKNVHKFGLEGLYENRFSNPDLLIQRLLLLAGEYENETNKDAIKDFIPVFDSIFRDLSPFNRLKDFSPFNHKNYYLIVSTLKAMKDKASFWGNYSVWLWECAQWMSYSDFYHAWNPSGETETS